MMKKTIGIIVAFFTAVILSFTLLTASAADTPVAVSSTPFETHQGETFTTTVYIPDNANIVDFDITLTYDTDLITLVNAEEHDDLRGDVMFNTDVPGTIRVNYTRTTQNITTYMPLVNLTFAVDENIGVGVYDCLSVDRNKTYIAHRLNNAGTLDTVDFSCDFAQLIIYEMGDVDLNCSVDIGDATYIRRHLAQLEGSILTPFKLSLADTYTDGSVDIGDAVCLQRHLAQLNVLYGDRVHIEFYLPDGTKYTAKSVFYDGTLNKIPSIPAEYEGYEWSLSSTEFVAPDYSNLTEDMKLYLFYDGVIDSQAMRYYKSLLTDMYYSGDLPSNMSSSINLKDTLYYQQGYHAMLTWSSSSNYVLNSTTGVFTKPTYPQELGLSINITSYDANDTIEGKGEITFDYLVPGIYITPTKAEVADFLKFYFTDYSYSDDYYTTNNLEEMPQIVYDNDGNGSSGRYRVNYDVKLLSKINNTVLPVEGAMYDNFEIRLNWYQNVNGELQPISQIKRTTSTQINDYVAVATFNGKPLEDDGKIYIDDVEVTAIDQMEIKNYIIQQIAASQGTLATEGTLLWNNDTMYGTTVTWETGNPKIGYVANNMIQLRDDAVSGSTLPLNARVSYAVDNGETEEFVLSYNLTVSCNNVIIKAPENMDPELYRAIKTELEETLGYRGDLTSAALANVKFVNLDLSGYPEISSLRGLSYCEHLRTLNISGLHITDGTMNQIATLSYLEAFIARGCGLDNLTDGGTATLRNAVNLKMIDLTDNNFTSLDSVFAEGVRYGSLREVYLSKNKLTDINALSRAPMMTYLSLSDNGLTTAGTQSIANYPYLVYLSLAHNKIDSVEHLKNLNNLKELRLQDNNLTNINDLRRLVNLQLLYIGHNQIQDIGFLNSLTELEVLYANDNRIFDISALNDLTKLEVLNVNNNNITSLSVLLNYRSTLTEVYAENNKVTDFTFINGASKLHILMLAGNSTEMIQDNMTSWLDGLTELEVLTLSDIRLSDLSFLASMEKLVRLDVANCGLTAFSNDESNIMAIANRYMTLKVLNISNNDLSDPTNEINKLRNLSLLTLFFADNVCSNLDINTITYAMPELKFISLENCGVNSMGWLTKYNDLVYVDLAGNNITDFDLDTYISNASIKTLQELYLDTTTENAFANAYRLTDFNVEKLSLEGIQVGKMEKMPYLDSIKYLNISNTGLTNLTGDDAEIADLYTIERYTTLKTVDVSGLETDIAPLENMTALQTVYAVDTAERAIFHEDNLHTLQRMYNKGVTCYLYDKQTEYTPVATVEGPEILALIDDISCDITVAADNQFSDNNPYLQDEINDFDITWTVSNNTNYEIKDNHLSVKDYTYIDDEALTVTATITVYPDQEPVSRTFTVNTHILRASDAYIAVDSEGMEDYMVRGTEFKYDVSVASAQTENFTETAKPVYDEIKYSYSAKRADDEYQDYRYVLTCDDAPQFAIKNEAPLGCTATITATIGHYTDANTFVSDAVRARITQVATRTFTMTYVTNGGTVTNQDGNAITSEQYTEDAELFTNITVERLGYIFKGWFTDEGLSQEFEETTMPMHDVTLYASWEANSFNLLFDANGGSVDTDSKLIVCDTAFGELPTATRQYYIFDGWFIDAEEGEQVTAESVMTRSDDLTVYAHWTPDTYILTFNANGGAVSESDRTVFCGQEIGSLPTPTRDYYNFLGWYTATSGGTKITTTTSFNKATTIYAQWALKPLQGPVKLSQVPAGAQTLNPYWTYTQRSTTTSNSSSVDGWPEYYDSSWVWSDYGDWSSWSKTQYYSSDSRQIETKTVTDDAAHTEYKYWIYRTTNGVGYGTKNFSTSAGYCTVYDSIQIRDKLNLVDSNNGLYGYYQSQKSEYKDKNWCNKWFEGGTVNVPAVTHTEWRYRDRSQIYTYYFEKYEDLESTTYPTGDGISNVQTWVQYREK